MTRSPLASRTRSYAQRLCVEIPDRCVGSPGRGLLYQTTIVHTAHDRPEILDVTKLVETALALRALLDRV